MVMVDMLDEMVYEVCNGLRISRVDGTRGIIARSYRHQYPEGFHLGPSHLGINFLQNSPILRALNDKFCTNLNRQRRKCEVKLQHLVPALPATSEPIECGRWKVFIRSGARVLSKQGRREADFARPQRPRLYQHLSPFTVLFLPSNRFSTTHLGFFLSDTLRFCRSDTVYEQVLVLGG
ncbi:hypothetical protein ASPVEDRAFT_264698 [Aspergillus versicolor CBS 583.65]|uniref:Uncharacterized protein n=1 Tax=Aspergillus versicolor CBS 583.65 TaxID=1036611 RepID=A0A1L9P660_ASPVE|nr:uncharacterized protein ASPVEDRAFT_264698 [Aspergillus versicolor CBS 583.65]OJI97010.1 hypothetical protein ASPVEDRAFT_264698 [Aspergillus versicolor CBS 583.65]